MEHKIEKDWTEQLKEHEWVEKQNYASWLGKRGGARIPRWFEDERHKWPNNNLRRVVINIWERYGKCQRIAMKQPPH